MEVAAFDLASARAAAHAGADRIELCRDASAGGLTPPLAWTREMCSPASGGPASGAVPVVVMIRAHAEGWTFTPEAHDAMRADAREAVRAGATGIVWGALREDSTVDETALRAMVRVVAPVPVIFHRAFDATPDLDAALGTLIASGVARVLTGGGPGRALDNADRIADLRRVARGRIGILPGGGVRSGNVAEIVRRTGATEVHSSASGAGAHAAASRAVDPSEVRSLRAALARG